LQPLDTEALTQIVQRALTDRKQGLGDLNVKIAPQALDFLVRSADGDARSALNHLEMAVALRATPSEPRAPNEAALIRLTDLEKVLQQKALRYDKSGEEHYNLISALHKSLRGSDPDAALYWLARMLTAGEAPLYIARRMVRFASEDIGLADPQALTTALAGLEAYRFLGAPEGELALAQVAVYLATAPKSNAVYAAYGHVRKAVRQHGALPVPLHIRNAPTELMKSLGYGQDYRYAHNHANAFVDQTYLPEAIGAQRYYHPSDRGYEKAVKHRLEEWRRSISKQAPARDGPKKEDS
jgi:putative ATPase